MQIRKKSHAELTFERLPNDVLAYIFSFMAVKKQSKSSIKPIPLEENADEFSVTAINKNTHAFFQACTPPQLRKVFNEKKLMVCQLEQKLKNSQQELEKLENIIMKIDSELKMKKFKTECKEDSIPSSTLSNELQKSVIALFSEIPSHALPKLSIKLIKEKIKARSGLLSQQIMPASIHLNDMTRISSLFDRKSSPF